MRAAVLIILAIALTALVESSPGIGDTRRPAPYVNRLPPPKPRFRRSADPEPQGSVSATWQKNLDGPERRPSYNVDYQQKLFENKHGSISATGGAQKYPGQRWEPTVGLQGSFRFRRSPEPQPEPQGSVSVTAQKNLSGPERRPSYNVDYQHKLFENKHGSISATAGAQKNPGQRVQPTVGVQGSFRFRRSPEPQPEPQGSVSVTAQKNLSGPERRPSYNVDYQHKLFENKHGSISATGGAQKYPGQRWEPTVGLQGSFRFRRSPEPQPEPQGSVSVTAQKNLSGPERRPSYNVDYQHKLFENKHGSISATAGAQKNPGQRVQPTVGVQGSFRFRRSPEPQPEPQGSVSVTAQKNLSGPERRPSYNVDYQHKLFENKHGSISATGGAQKYPGQRWEPTVGVQGSFRFRRSPEPQPEPQGSVRATWQKNLSGPERRPSYNVDYQHKLFENKHGSISATGGAQKYPGQRWEPTVGIQGSFRFRRAAESESEEKIVQQN
ncbi:uncharacterized protein [Neodiprion pinetum]|uniref:Uncharacterized protein LOC107219157 n=1 Tax=Neodiprion lecontei TaxID=441921 RepID=A0ABM3G7Y5_NEOLC|nr:uncharacterized protein LOC124219367 [Neodiprion pinetum]XP_046596387.1 uncharacterized protein LOC107219157 [Neodiprion lecontei]